MMGLRVWAGRIGATLALALMVSGCSTLPNGKERLTNANSIAAAKKWHSQIIPSQPFQLMAWTPQRITPAHDLTIYIEGDGLAWISRSQQSQDPTPTKATALSLALAHPQGNAAYLARPCQYVGANTNKCSKDIWGTARFSQNVVTAINQGVTALKSQFKAQNLTLVGYSGGAAIAALLAAQRNDVTALITVAGNLDHAAWTKHHAITPLDKSLNPVQHRQRLADIPQWHFAGAKDKVIPPKLLQDWSRNMPNAKVQIMQGVDHSCCWAEIWPSLYPKP